LVSWPVSTQEAAQTAVNEAVPAAQVVLASAATGQLAAAKAALAVVFQTASSPTAQRSSSADMILFMSQGNLVGLPSQVCCTAVFDDET